MDRGLDGADHRPRHGDLGQLDADGPGMPQDPGANLDELSCRLVSDHGHGLRQPDIGEEDGEVVGPRMQPQPHVVVPEPAAEEPRPADGVLAFADVLLGGAAAVVEPADPLGVHRQVGHDEAHTWEYLAGAPLDLRHQAARLVPVLRMILEVLVDAADVFGRATDQAPQPMRNVLLQEGVGGQPDGLEVACRLQGLVQIGQRGGGVGAAETHQVPFRISLDDRRQHRLPAIGAVDVGGAQRSSIPNCLNRKSGC